MDDKEETLNNNDDEYDYDELLSTLNTHKMAAASASPVSQQLQAMLAHEKEEQIFVAGNNRGPRSPSEIREVGIDPDVTMLARHIQATHETAQASILSLYQKHKHSLQQENIAQQEDLRLQYQQQQDYLKDSLAHAHCQLRYSNTLCERLVGMLHHRRSKHGSHSTLRLFFAWRDYSRHRRTALHHTRLAIRHGVKTEDSHS
jgi:2-succinyl-5-enolpyruvyl-6-hydroxy-3-cyclohexene-1-carboxylate synthase